MSLSSSTSVLATVGATLICSQLWAATEIQQKGVAISAPKTANAQAQTSTILLDASHARMEVGSAEQYMLFDFTQQKMTMVNAQQKQAIDMSSLPKMPENLPKPPAQADAAPVKVELVKVGKGPEIAGFSTEHYQVKADGKVCSNEFISAEAMNIEYVENFMQSMHKMAAERRKNMKNMPFFKQDPCAKAAEQSAGDMLKHGMLMRSQDSNGQLRNEIVSIKTDVAAKAEDFTVPADFEVMTPQQMMQRAMQNRGRQGQGGQNAPQISPEMREKMQQEMMKRMEEARQQQQQ